MKNLNNPLIQQMGAAAQEVQKARSEAFNADFTGFDWNSLASTIPQEPEGGWWHITLEKFLPVDADNNFIREVDAPNIPGAKPGFILNCGQGSMIRLMEQIYGLPNSQTILRYDTRISIEYSS